MDIVHRTVLPHDVLPLSQVFIAVLNAVKWKQVSCC